MIDILIRKPFPEDAYDIRRIQSEGWLDNNLSMETGVTREFLQTNRKISLPPSSEKVEETKRTIAGGVGAYFVATHEDRVAGWIMSSCLHDDVFGFGIYVDRQYRSKSVGAKLLSHLLSSAPRKYTIDVTETNKRGIKFYEKFGFRISEKKKHYFDDNLDVYLPVVVMRNYKLNP